MRKTKKLSYTTLILIISLFQGCSGHALQDLIDGKSSESDVSQQRGNKDENAQTVAPSQNKVLNSISPSSTASDEHKEYRYMQQNTNAWIENEWEPLTESNTSETAEVKSATITSQSDANATVSQEDNSSSGLQYYVDKAALYFENKKKRDTNKTKAPSHVDKIDKMPGIGKKTTR